MVFSPATKQIIEWVEQLTQKPVQVAPDPSLATLAKVRIAQSDDIAHIITYKPGAVGVDYQVAFQCGFILRLYQNPPDARFGFAGLDAGRAFVKKQLSGPGGTLVRYNLPPEEVDHVTDQVFDGLMVQLRSLPIGMRIDRWLWQDYPEMREAQKVSIGAQNRMIVQTIGPQVRAISPPSLFSANVAMSAAYALFSDQLLVTQIYSIPFRSVGMTDRGRALLDLWEHTPAGAEYDRELVNAWGNELGLSDWYTWIPVR